MSKFKIAILGNLNNEYGPHAAMNKSFSEFAGKMGFSFQWISTETLVEDSESRLKEFKGIVAGSGPYKSKGGIINGIRFARINNIPFLGTCSGFGYAILEFGQWLFNMAAVHHPYEGVALADRETFLQTLGDCSVDLHTISFKPVNGTLTDKLYGDKQISEKSHCAYGISAHMVDVFEKKGMVVSGRDEHGEPKIMEYKPNDFFMITLFYPQMRSDIENPHPLLLAFFKAAELRANKGEILVT